jgi:S-formylglutathione hydrolase FrmB
MHRIFFVGVLSVLLAPLALSQGRVDCRTFKSHILQWPVRYCVMLPPDYEKNADKKYPVLYFLHGLGESEQALFHIGGWGRIEDLRRERKVGDFLVVAPEGRATFFINSAGAQDRYSDFFISEFLPQVESQYRVVRNRGSRGITGLSMGGYGALRFAFAYPQLFSSVSVQSPALITEKPQELNDDLRQAGPLAQLLGQVFGNPIDVVHWRQNDPFILVRKNRIRIANQAIYINCGEQDEYGFASGATKLHKQLETEKIPHEFHLYPGGHNADYFLSHFGETIEFHWHTFTSSSRNARR